MEGFILLLSEMYSADLSGLKSIPAFPYIYIAVFFILKEIIILSSESKFLTQREVINKVFD